MKNLLVVTISLLAIVLAGAVNAATVSDPNHKGWSGKYPKLKQVSWKPVVPKCDKCKLIAAQYNETVQELLIARYWVHFWRETARAREKGKASPFWSGKGDITEFEGEVVAANLELSELHEVQLTLHKQAVLQLEQQAHYLSSAISDCERQACLVKKPTKLKQIKLAGANATAADQPDIGAVLRRHNIGWNGPYSTDCRPCTGMVEQLNALPGWVVRADMQLQRAEAKVKLADAVNLSNGVHIGAAFYSHPDKTDYSGLAAQIAKLKAELAAFKRLFEKLVKDLAECAAKYCPSAKDEDASYLPAGGLLVGNNCPQPAASEPITVGPNSEVGSSANFKEKAKKKAAGLATKAITGLLSIGGGGGGKSEGPTTYKDPVKKKLKVRNKADKREIRLGGVFTPDGLLVSTDIKKAPGKGTFHSIYLENQRGWQLVPIALYMYEIWADWKLNVSWTRDTYVDGQLVKHEQGGWSESWRELIASGEELIYGEVPIWQQLGFNTAVSGARSLGTLFPLSPAMLAQEPINLVIHISDPKKDPVMTVPYIFQLSLDNKGRVVVEEVDQTAAANGPPCTEPAPVIAATPVDNSININDDSGGNGIIDEDGKTPACPDNWVCKEGKQCPPLDNCTTGSEVKPPGVAGTDEDIEGIEVTGTRIRTPMGGPVVSNPVTTTPQSTTEAGSQVASGPDETGLEEIEVTSSRIRRIDDQPVTVPMDGTTPTPQAPGQVTSGPDDVALEEIEVTGSRIKRPLDDKPISIPMDEGSTPAVTGTNNPATPEPSTTELEEVEVSGTRYDSTTTTLGYDLDLKGGYGTGLGLEYKYEETPESTTTTPPPTIYGEEIDPPVVGIVLKFFDRRWIPRYKDYTFVYSKMYVPGPGGSSWIPHKSVARRMELTFIQRSSEKGKAMNANLPAGPQDSPDLYLDPGRNAGIECRDDPTGKGHYGTCKTISPHNEYMWGINSDDYGAFSRLDVSCEGCVPLTPVAGLYPETFTRGQRWEVALPELDREKRAVYVPHDSNKNQVSDGYPPDMVSFHGASEDSENTPAGNGVSGDGLSAYEEYRGFIDLYGRHKRSDWDKKTLLVENANRLSLWQFETASGLEVIPLDTDGHENRIVNFNSGHANVVDQHGLRLVVFPGLDDKYAGLCTGGCDRPKNTDEVQVKPSAQNTATVAHELGHAVGMEHHGNVPWPEEESIRFMTSGFMDLLPGRVHSDPKLCGKTLPASFKVGTKGDQGSGNHHCIMKYGHYHYVYEQAGGDYDCMPSTPRSIFDDSATGTGPNGFNRTAGDASNGNCLSQIWINSK